MGYRWMAGLLAALGAVGTMGAQAAQFNCDSDLPDLGNASCATLVGDLVPPRFTQAYPAGAYRIVLMAASARYDDGGVSGYALAGVVPEGAGYPDDPVIIQFRSSGRHDDAALAIKEKSTLRSAVALLMKNLNVAAPARKHK